ncbi:MAG: hypothetical protein GXO79_04175 [Chlorobi bacterium]|nr:hypothetical protein [Chlorobiota bacterium]
MEKLLIEIARCENFFNCKNTDCENIVNFQKQVDKQLPEPWNGNIENSRILFISSNPSINENEIYPLASWKDSEIIDFFQYRFSKSRDYVKNLLYPKHKEGYAKNWIRYWGFIRSISRKLLNRQNVVPGIDYSLMEIVRCKSHNEYGVAEALDVCAEKYLIRTLSLSKAKVLVAVGDKSRDILKDKLNIAFLENRHIEKEIGGTKRIIFATPHSNARKKRTLETILNSSSINEIKEKLK